jgi:ketosteroid isomerase-like protein
MATNKELIENLYSCFAVGDVPAVLGAMADDIRWAEADGFPLAGTYVGPQAVLDGVFMRLGEIGDHFSVVPEQYVADGDTVVMLGTYTWKHTATGEPASVKMAHVWTIRDGKIAAFQQHVDTVRVRELS